MRRARRLAMAVDDFGRLSNIPELHELQTWYYNWEVDAYEPTHLLLVLAATGGLLTLCLVLRAFAKRYRRRVKLPKELTL